MIPRIWVGLLMAPLLIAGCADDADEPEGSVVETVDLDEVPTVAPPTESPTPTTNPSPTTLPEPTPLPESTQPPLPDLRVWPTAAPLEWPRTPDDAAAAFARDVALGDRAAEPRPAAQDGMTATAELPRLREDGSRFGVATTIHMQEAQLDDGTITWVVISAQSADIVVDSPAIGQPLAGGTVVRGEGQGFEGTIVFQVEDQDGLLGLTLAQGGALGENLPFHTDLPFDERPASGDWAILVGYTTSAVDGSLSALTMLPMRLVDGS